MAWVLGPPGARASETISAAPALAVPAVDEAASDPHLATEIDDQRTVAVSARIVGDQRRTQFIIDWSRPIDFSIFLLADPYRLVVDLPEVTFALPVGSGASGRGLVSAYRYGLISRGKSRIVLDLTGPVRVDKAFFVFAAEAQPPRVVFDVVPTTREAFLQVSNADREARSMTVPQGKFETVHTPGRVGSLPIVVLDPGHGGIDAGASAAGLLEKEITLDFAKVLAAKLAATGRYQVELTREDDTYFGLMDRVEFARRVHAQLFIALHADSFRRTVRGATVYTLSEKASGDMAASIAAVENRSDILAGLDTSGEANQVADILVDLARRETKNFSAIFANTLVADLRQTTLLFKNPHQQAAFVVLKAPDVPSVLLELGYLSNIADQKLLVSPVWRERTAQAVVRAIDGYFTRPGAGVAVR